MSDETLTDRDHACLHMKAPITGKPWLDDVIREGRRLDFLQASFISMNEKAKTKDGADPQADESQIANVRRLAREYSYELFPQHQK